MVLAIIYFGDFNVVSVEYVHSEDMLFHDSQLCVDKNQLITLPFFFPPPPPQNPKSVPLVNHPSLTMATNGGSSGAKGILQRRLRHKVKEGCTCYCDPEDSSQNTRRDCATKSDLR